MRERDRDGAGDGRVVGRERHDHAAHVVGARLLEGGHEPGQVLRGIRDVCVHPHDDLTGGRFDADVQPDRGDPQRVVEQANLRVRRGQLRHDTPRPVVAPPVHDEHFEAIRGIARREDRLQARADVPLLGATGQDDRDERKLTHARSTVEETAA